TLADQPRNIHYLHILPDFLPHLLRHTVRNIPVALQDIPCHRQRIRHGFLLLFSGLYQMLRRQQEREKLFFGARHRNQ
ncbi:hypothetical protein, partial [Salmonella enterica]|uniref:hypothetical protein n=1 Tax=Salmonella enterica TaxID=28901 RepID=UPI001C3EEC59